MPLLPAPAGEQPAEAWHADGHWEERKPGEQDEEGEEAMQQAMEHSIDIWYIFWQCVPPL